MAVCGNVPSGFSTVKSTVRLTAIHFADSEVLCKSLIKTLFLTVPYLFLSRNNQTMLSLNGYTRAESFIILTCIGHYERTKKTQHPSKLPNRAIHHLKIAWEYLRHLSETQIEFELHLRAAHKRLLFPIKLKLRNLRVTCGKNGADIGNNTQMA